MTETSVNPGLWSNGLSRLGVFVPPRWEPKRHNYCLILKKAAPLLSEAVARLACFLKHGNAMRSGAGTSVLRPVWVFPTVP